MDSSCGSSNRLKQIPFYMSKRVLIASTIGAVAKSLGGLCEKHGAAVTYSEHGKTLYVHQLIDGNHQVLMVEINFIEGEHRDLIARIFVLRNNCVTYSSLFMPLK